MAQFAFDGDTELEHAHPRRRLRRRPLGCGDAAAQPRRRSRTPRSRTATRSARPPRRELPAVFAMTVEAFAEHWGQFEAGEQRLDEWIESPAFRLDQVVIAWKGDEPVAMVNGELETKPDGTMSGLLAGVCTHPAHRRLGLARACIVESLRRLRDAGRHQRLPRRGHRQPEPGLHALRVVRVPCRDQQRQLPQALQTGGHLMRSPSGRPAGRLRARRAGHRGPHVPPGRPRRLGDADRRRQPCPAGPTA